MSQYAADTDDHFQLDALKQAVERAAGRFADPAKLTQARVYVELRALSPAGAGTILTAEGMARRFGLRGGGCCAWSKATRAISDGRSG